MNLTKKKRDIISPSGVVLPNAPKMEHAKCQTHN
jgi:hypothetical protein